MYCFSKGWYQQEEGVLTILEMVKYNREGKYLGLPYLIGMPNKEIFQCIKDRVWKKVWT